MNDKQKKIFGNDFGLIYFPYEFKDAINNHCSYAYTDDQKNSLSEMGKFWKFIDHTTTVWNGKEDSLVIIQDESNEIGTLTFIGLGVKKIEIIYKEKVNNLNLVKSIFKGMMVGNISIDFDNPIEKLKFHFLYEMAEPYVLNVELIKYKEPEIDYQTLYLTNMNIFAGVGQSLVNIYFKKAKDCVNKTEIELFRVIDLRKSYFMVKESVKEGSFFHTFSNLAYGTYKFRIIQYCNEEKIIESPMQEFNITEPNYSGKPYISGR
jgi:hypothetical protein